MFAQEQKLACPYNKSHTFSKEKYLFHLRRCKDKQKVQHLYAKCQYNPFHIVFKGEIAHHESTCCDRQQQLQIENNLRRTYKIVENEPRERSREKMQPQFLKQQNCVKQQLSTEDTLSECQQCKNLIARLQFEIQSFKDPKLSKMLLKYYQLGIPQI